VIQQAYLDECIDNLSGSLELSSKCELGSPVPPGQQLVFSTVTENPDLESLLSANGSLSCRNAEGTNLTEMLISVVSVGPVCRASQATEISIPVSTIPD